MSREFEKYNNERARLQEEVNANNIPKESFERFAKSKEEKDLIKVAKKDWKLWSMKS